MSTFTDNLEKLDLNPGLDAIKDFVLHVSQERSMPPTDVIAIVDYFMPLLGRPTSDTRRLFNLMVAEFDKAYNTAKKGTLS